MSRDEGAKRRGRGTSPGAEIRAELGEAMKEVRSALRDVREATSSLSGLGALIGDVVRTVTDVDTIKALADPTRLAILRALMLDAEHGPRVMSVKELAEELGEPQTKLYRHIKVLETAHLIEAAETRLVSGIVETRYRAAQTELYMDAADLKLDELGEDVMAMIAVAMNEYRDRFLAAQVKRYEQAVANGTDQALAFRSAGSVLTAGCRVPPAKAEEFQKRVADLVRDIDAAERDPDGVAVQFLLSWYAPPTTDEAGGRAGPAT